MIQQTTNHDNPHDDMTKISFSVSHQGKFVFRTEPEEDPERIERTQQGLLLAFKAHRGYKITREAHTTTRNACDLFNG